MPIQGASNQMASVYSGQGEVKEDTVQQFFEAIEIVEHKPGPIQSGTGRSYQLQHFLNRSCFLKVYISSVVSIESTVVVDTGKFCQQTLLSYV
jgi:hypothetical protein